jgi:hypothetical protein
MPDPTPTFRKIREAFLKEEGIDLGTPLPLITLIRLELEACVMNFRRHLAPILTVKLDKRVIALLRLIQDMAVLLYVNALIRLNRAKGGKP